MQGGGSDLSDVMKTLGLTHLEKALPALFEQARQQKMTYETFLQRALDAEVEGRNLRAAQRRIQAARLPVTKTLESFEFSFQPSISERLVRELADLSFIQTASNVILEKSTVLSILMETNAHRSDLPSMMQPCS